MRIRRASQVAVPLLLLVLLFPRAASATSLTLNNSWVALDEVVSGVGNPASGWFTGTGTMSPAAGTPYTWNSSSAVRLDITDYMVVGDGFQVFDFGVLVGTFSSGPSWTAIPGCTGPALAITAACHHTLNPDVAWLDPIFNQGSLVFAPGAHSITIFDTAIPSDFDSGTVAFRAEPVPEPASMILLGTGLVAIARRRMRRRQG